MDSHQINNQLKSGEKYNRNKRNTQSNKKHKENHQKINDENIKQNSERLNKKNNSEERNSNNENIDENVDNSENNDMSQSQDKKPIYVMSLELEDGNTAKIKIYSDSNPEVLSKEFCEQNNLEPDAAEYLSNQIEALIEQ